MGGPGKGGFGLVKGWIPEGMGPPPEEWSQRGPRRGGTEPRKGGAPKGGPRRVGGPKFRAFFTLSRSHFRSFSSLSGGSSRGILVVFEDRDLQMCMFGLSGCRGSFLQ